MYLHASHMQIIYIWVMLTSAVQHWLRILWEPKMCRLAWQLLGMLGNVLGLLGMLRNVLGMPWQGPRHACNVLGLLGMLPARS